MCTESHPTINRVCYIASPRKATETRKVDPRLRSFKPLANTYFFTPVDCSNWSVFDSRTAHSPRPIRASWLMTRFDRIITLVRTANGEVCRWDDLATISFELTDFTSRRSKRLWLSVVKFQLSLGKKEVLLLSVWSPTVAGRKMYQLNLQAVSLTFYFFTGVTFLNLNFLKWKS